MQFAHPSQKEVIVQIQFKGPQFKFETLFFFSGFITLKFVKSVSTLRSPLRLNKVWTCSMARQGFCCKGKSVFAPCAQYMYIRTVSSWHLFSILLNHFKLHSLRAGRPFGQSKFKLCSVWFSHNGDLKVETYLTNFKVIKLEKNNNFKFKLYLYDHFFLSRVC